MQLKTDNNRIMTIDVMKGLAIIGLVVIHALVYGIFTPKPDLYDELVQRAPPFVLVLLAPIVLLSSWYVLFLFINGMTVGFSFLGEYKKENPNYKSVLYRKLTNAITLILLGALYSPLLSFTAWNDGEYRYSVLTGSIMLGEIVPLDVSRLYSHTLLAGIGLCSIGVSTVLYFALQYSSPNMGQKAFESRIVKLLIILSIIWMGLTYALEMLNDSVAFLDTFEESGRVANFQLMVRVFGKRTSIFPSLIFGFSGAVFGVYLGLNSEDTREKINRFGYRFGLAYVLISVFSFFFYQGDIVSIFVGYIYPTILNIGNLGLILLITTLLINKLDFSTKRGSVLKRTRTIRRFAITSMTVYALEGLVAVIFRVTYIGLFGSEIFPWNFWVDISFMGLVFIFWDRAIRIWERWNFVGSFEWMTIKLMERMGSSSSRLNVEGILYAEN